MVVHNEANAIALVHLNRGPGSAAVVTPQINDFARNNFLLYRLGDEMEFLDVAIEAKRKVGYIWRLRKHRSVAVMHSLPLRFHFHAGHVPMHLHFLGGQHFRGSENSCSRENIPQKSSPVTHLFPFQRRTTEFENWIGCIRS